MVRFILFRFLIWRLALFIVAALAARLLIFSPSYPYWESILAPSGLPIWLWSWAGFDGVHYLTIAAYGYSAQFTQAFFPLYPLLIKIISPFWGGHLVMSGLLASNLFFLLALFLFYKLLILDFKKNIYWMITFVFIFPTSFFFGAFYNESLFISLVFASFLAARQKNWWIAGIFGGLASATRLVGVFLLPALFVEWIQQESIKKQISNIKDTYQSLKRKKILHSLWLLFIPLGLITYMVYLQIQFSDSLYFLHAQPFFGASRSGGQIILLPQVIWRYLKIFATVSFSAYDFWIALAEFFTFWLVSGLLLLAHKEKVRPSYLIFSWLIFLTPTLTGTFSSLPRYVLPAFPIFIVLGNVRNTRVKALLAFLSGTLLLIATALYTRGRWVA
jgi:hypothetical protein